MAGILRKIGTTLEMIKWEHSIFALPFALTAMLLAAQGLPSWRALAWIVVAMIAARSAAMAFNRWADADLDAVNPRTSNWAIPAGLLSRTFVLGFTCIAVRGSLYPRIVVLTAAVTLWAGGFDVLYACQDFEHDRAAGLHSLPQSTSVTAAFWIARCMHLAMLVGLVWFG